MVVTAFLGCSEGCSDVLDLRDVEIQSRPIEYGPGDSPLSSDWPWLHNRSTSRVSA